jgi:glutaminase
VARVVNPRDVDALIIDAQRVVHWDVTALEAIKRLAKELSAAKVPLAVTHLQGEELEALRDHLDTFANTDAALEWAEDEVLRRQGLGAALKGKPVGSIADLPLLSAVSEPGRAALTRFGHLKHAAAGQMIFDAGQKSDELMLVLRGAVRLEVGAAANRATTVSSTIRIATFTSGMLFGEMAFLDASVRSARAVAVEDTVLFTLSRLEFERWAQIHAPDATAFLSAVSMQLANRMRSTTSQLIALNP